MPRTKVFITGATGFVGRHLMNALHSSNYVLSGTSYPDPPHPSEKHIFFLDLRSEREVYETLKSVRPQWIFHLAAVSNVRHSWEKRRETMETNIMGTFTLFEAAKKFAPGARILYISSSDVYGIPADEESGERRRFLEDDPFHVASPYAVSKIGGELLAGFYCRVEGLDIVIVRPFPHTGPGQSPEFVCSDWARQVIQIERGRAEPALRVGNLDIRRDFCDVRDTVRAYVLLMQKGRRGEIYNVCRGEGTLLRRIVEIYLSLTAKAITIEQDPARLRKVDIPFLVGDNGKLRKETSWEPQIPLERTLRDLLDYWRARP
jgi:GDP-4-dehydro-6-deoxy-D-mannose reductase